MPNWCSNTLQIEGSPKELSKLMKDVEITASEATAEHYAQVISCQRIIPRPSIKDSDWYEWNIANWGSKWDLSDPRRDDSEWENGKLLYYFETAWSPVMEVITTLAKKYPKLLLTYTYWEGGSDYWGDHSFKDGVMITSEEGELSNANCERLNYLLGSEHHSCIECYEQMECEGEDVTYLCDSCNEDITKTEAELWEGDTNDNTQTELTNQTS